MTWWNRLLCAFGWEASCPRQPDPEQTELRARLDRVVRRHHLDDDDDERLYRATRARVDILLEGERRAQQPRG